MAIDTTLTLRKDFLVEYESVTLITLFHKQLYRPSLAKSTGDITLNNNGGSVVSLALIKSTTEIANYHKTISVPGHGNFEPGAQVPALIMENRQFIDEVLEIVDQHND